MLPQYLKGTPVDLVGLVGLVRYCGPVGPVGSDGTLIIQKSTAIPPSPMILFVVSLLLVIVKYKVVFVLIVCK